MTAFAAALAAFLTAALCGKPLIRFLERKKLTGLAMQKKAEALVPDIRPVAEMGGLLYLAGLFSGSILGILFSLIKGSALFSLSSAVGKSVVLLIGTGLMAMVGLLEDWRKVRKLSPLSSWLRLLLLFGISFSFLIGIRLTGDYSNILLLPFWGGQLDLGNGWTVCIVFLLLGAAYGGRKMSAVPGQSVGVLLAVSLGCGGIFAVFSTDIIRETAFASAGALLGLALFTFPPEKIREGNGMRLAGSVFPMMAAIAGGAPLFVLFMGLPFIFEGIYAMIKICAEAFGKVLSAESFGAFLMEKGLSGKAVSGIYAGVTLLGGVLAAAASVLYL